MQLPHMSLVMLFPMHLLPLRPRQNASQFLASNLLISLEPSRLHDLRTTLTNTMAVAEGNPRRVNTMVRRAR